MTIWNVSILKGAVTDITINSFQLFPLTSNTCIPFLSFSEVVLGEHFLWCLWLCYPGCLNVLNAFKLFTFHGLFDLGEESEATPYRSGEQAG